MSKATPRIDLARFATCAALAACAAFATVACVEATPLPAADPEPPPPDSPPIDFVYETADGGRLTAAELRGRFTVLAFVATYDLASQAQVKILGLVQRDHTPRVNVAVIAMEPVENRPLVIAFQQSLDLHFPVAIADARTVEGRGPFSGLNQVPSTVILDREGREVFRHAGTLDEKKIRAELDRLGKRR